MKILLVGAPDSNVPLHIMTVIQDVIREGQDKFSFHRLYFLDHRSDNREVMTKYVCADNTNTDLDITYKISTCSSLIMTQLIDNLQLEAHRSDRLTRLIIYFNLDSIATSNPTILRTIFKNLETMSEKLPVDILCLSTRRVLNHALLSQFDQIHIFKDTSPPSLEGLMKYLVDMGKIYENDRLQELIASLDTDSKCSVSLSKLTDMSKGDIIKNGRIVIE